MYPKEFFKEQFSEIETSELFVKLSAQDLVDNAKDAISEILVSRGISKLEIDTLSKEAHKALIRQSRGTTECDYCGNSAKRKPVFDDGQRFCSTGCLQAARVSEAAVDLTKLEIEQMAGKIRSGSCPQCGEMGSPIEVRFNYSVMSFVAFTRYERKSRICCVSCGRKENLNGFLLTLILGWWGIPWGILMTPAYLLANVGEMFEKRKVGEPSDDLLREAKYRLAVSTLNKNSRNAINEQSA